MESVEDLPSAQSTKISSLSHESSDSRLSTSDEIDADSTIHAFNLSNITVIENPTNKSSIADHNNDDDDGDNKKNHNNNNKLILSGGDGGSDSGVETNDLLLYRQRSLLLIDGDDQFERRSCDSSTIINCYDEAFNLLVRRNSTLFCNGGGDRISSDNGSESSSITGGSSSSRNSKPSLRNATNTSNHLTAPTTKKRVLIGTTTGSSNYQDGQKKSTTTMRDRSRSKQSTIVTTPKNRQSSKSSSHNKTSSSSSGTAAAVPNKKQVITPNSLAISSSSGRRDGKKSGGNSSSSSSTTTTRTSSCTRTPVVTPTDDGRWPSVNSKPAPLMSRSVRGIIDTDITPKSKPALTSIATATTLLDANNCKTIEKYATLPRRRKEKSADDVKNMRKKSSSKEENLNRFTSTTSTTQSRNNNNTNNINKTPIRTNFMMKSHHQKKQKIKIYHETCIQTALTMTDIDKAMAGLIVTATNPRDKEKCDQDIQVDMTMREYEELQDKFTKLNVKYEQLTNNYQQQSDKLCETETKLRAELVEKNGLKDELKINTERVLAILGGDDSHLNGDTTTSSDSLMVLENRFQNVSQVVINQEEEISKLNSYCRTLQINLEKSQANENHLVQQQHDLEQESIELHDFLQAEKTTLADALKEAESEIQRLNVELKTTNNDLLEKEDECKRYRQLNERRWQENLTLQAKLGSVEGKSRELLVHQGSSLSGTAVALSALIGRLDGLVEELVSSYNISEQELEDVIFHNEAYSHSNSTTSSDATTPDTSVVVVESPSQIKSEFSLSSSPKKMNGNGGGSSFVSAVINAIRNAAGSSDSNNRQCDLLNNSSVMMTTIEQLSPQTTNNEMMLDSETEPCLMMENVLEDVILPDGHSHNMISSSSHSLNTSFTTVSNINNDLMFSLNDIFPSISLVDQVIDVDNLVTKLLKVIRIIQLENDDCMNEVQEQRDDYADQVAKHAETNKIVVKQLKDWEVLGARLKSEVRELMNQLSRKNHELDNIKTELNKQREEVEKLNQDVCELSTALAKAEHETRIKEEEAMEVVKKWEHSGESPDLTKLGRLILTQNEVSSMKDELTQKQRHLTELSQEFVTSRQMLTQSLTAALDEAKKQYNAIDNALEVLHNNQSVVQQCIPLAELQRDLENVSFQTALMMPPPPPPPLVLPTPADCNANAAALLQQAIANLQINTTA